MQQRLKDHSEYNTGVKVKILFTTILIFIYVSASAQKRNIILCGIALPKKESGIFINVEDYKSCNRTLTVSDSSFKVVGFTLELLPDNPNILAIIFPVTNAQIPDNLTSYICSQVKSIHFKNIIAINQQGKEVTIPQAEIGVKLH
jgi:hypothetical protein